ncbi:retrovirus-related pol polyprotein from transposon TNT 1-94 [Tanacetum coccineum]
MALHLVHQSEDLATMILLSKIAAGVTICFVSRTDCDDENLPENISTIWCADRLAEHLRREHLIRLESSEDVKADSLERLCLIYRIPYVLIGLHILEEEWRGKDTSLTHLKDSGRSYEEYSEDRASSKEGGSETPKSYSEALSNKESVQWKKAINEEMVSFEKNQTCSLVRISAGKKASQRLWMFKVKEEQNDRKNYKDILVVMVLRIGISSSPSYEGALNETSTPTQNEGFQQFRSRSKPKNYWNEEPCSDVHQVGDEIEVEALRSFNWRLSELIMEDGFLLEREELERFKLRSGKVRLADDKILNIIGVGDVVLKTSFSTSLTLKDVRYIPGLKRRLILIGQLDEQGYHIGFEDQ